jgi:hypothetical protein
LHLAEEVEFSSTLRDESECPQDRSGLYPFIERLMREHDAFAPNIGMFYGGAGLKPGFQTTLDLTARSLNLDIDYSEGVPDDYPLFARLDFVAL